MMNNIKRGWKFLFLFSIVFLAIGCGSKANSENNENDENSALRQSQQTQLEESSVIEQYQKVHAGFRIDSGRTVGKPVYVYDECFGGAYMTDEKKLVVLLTENTPENQKRVMEFVEQQEVVFESCEYSLTKLHEVISTINDNLNKLKGNGSDFSSMSLDEKNNCVIIRIRNLNSEKEAMVREIIDTGCMVIENTTEINEFE